MCHALDAMFNDLWEHMSTLPASIAAATTNGTNLSPDAARSELIVKALAAALKHGSVTVPGRGQLITHA